MHKPVFPTMAKGVGLLVALLGLTGFLGHRNQLAILRTDTVDSVKRYRFTTPVRQALLTSQSLDLLSTYDHIRNVYGMRLHVATVSLLGPKSKLACDFRQYQSTHDLSWRSQNHDNMGIVATYLLDDHRPLTVVLHSVVADTRANGSGEKKYLHRQLRQSYRGLERAGVLVMTTDGIHLAESYQAQPIEVADFESWRLFNDRFVRTRDMGDEIVFRLAPQHASIAFHPSPLNRFDATPETVRFNTRTIVKALIRVQIDLESALVQQGPRGLTLPIVNFLRSNSLPCPGL